MLPKPSTEGRSLEVPVWVPRIVGVLALDMYSELIHGPFDRETAAIARFATDEKMKKVWDELLRRQRDGAQYLHPANEVMVRSIPNFDIARHLAPELPEPGRLQEQAAALLFHQAVQLLWRYHGPRIVRTTADIGSEIKPFRTLAARLREDARTLCCLGLSRHFASLEQAAGDCEKQIARIQQPDPPDPFVVERRSTRAGGDDRTREFIILISKICNALFGARLHGTVATLANVAFQQTNFTKDHVRSVVRQPGRDDGGGINVLLC